MEVCFVLSVMLFLYNYLKIVLSFISLLEKCPYSKFSESFSIFRLKRAKYRPEKILFLNTFYAVYNLYVLQYPAPFFWKN